MWKTGKPGFRLSEHLVNSALKNKKKKKIRKRERGELTEPSRSGCQVLGSQKALHGLTQMFFSLLPSGIEPTRLVMLGIHRGRLDLGTMSQTWRSVPGQRVRHT